MTESLLGALPTIVAAGKKQASQILEQLEGRHRVTLQTRELVVPARDAAQGDILTLSRARSDSTSVSNRLIYGDNLLAMAALLSGDMDTESLRGRIDLVYIDPPFDSKADYRTQVSLPGSTIEQRPTVLEQFAYSDTWAQGTASYLSMITPRLVLIRELLAETGSLYVHLDWHVGHYVKTVLDDIFGKDRFINEIVWHYPDKMQGNIRGLPNNHDVIFLYTKSKNFVWNGVKIHLDKPRKINRRVWNPETQRLDTAFDDSGRVIYDTYTEKNADDVWQIPQAEVTKNPNKTGYNTEKPETILRRVIEASTNPGDLVADFFVGSGTAVAVADRLSRRWIGVDLGKPAVMVTRKRMIDQASDPFLYQAIGDYQVEQARSTLGRNYRVGELAHVVLVIYGALPLPPEHNPGRNLGRVPADESQALVFVDSPSRFTTASTLMKVQQLRESVMGGFERAVVLGWNFAASIGQDVAALNDPKLEVLVIPPDLLDRLKKKGGAPSDLAGQVRFSSLQYLEAEVSSVERQGERDLITVSMRNYVLLSPDALSLDQANRKLLQRLINEEPLALIEYWAVDPNYDGQVFRSVWQDYRENTASNGDRFRVITEATVVAPALSGPRTVCIRAVDVFGFEAEVVCVVDETR
ncbi:MAG: site-specific DNA-methyltransferase [Candidatus Dormibacteria bacterium]